MSQSQNSEELSPLAAEKRACNYQSHSYLLEQNQRLMESNAELRKQVLQLTKDVQEMKLQQTRTLNRTLAAPVPDIHVPAPATVMPALAAPKQAPSRGFISTPERGIENVTPPMTTPGLNPLAGTPAKPLSTAQPGKVSPQPQGMVKQDTSDRQRLAMMAAAPPVMASGLSPFTGTPTKPVSTGEPGKVSSQPQDMVKQDTSDRQRLAMMAAAQPVTTQGMSPFSGTLIKPLGTAEPSKVSPQPQGMVEQDTSDRQRLGMMAVSAAAGEGGSSALVPTAAASQPKTKFPGFTPNPASATSKPSQTFSTFSFSPSTIKPAPSLAKPATTSSSSSSSFTGFSFSMGRTSASSTSTILSGVVFKPASSAKHTLQPPAGGSPVVFSKTDLTQDTRSSSPSQTFSTFSFSPSTIKPAPSLAKPATTSSSSSSPFTGFSLSMGTTSASSTSTVLSGGVFKPASSAKHTLQPPAGGSPVVFSKTDLTQDTRSSSPGYPGFYTSPKALPGTPSHGDQIVPSTRKPVQIPLAKDASSPKVADTPMSVSFKADVEDDGVIFISMIEPSPEQRARAEKLLLPEGFYLYEDAPPCKGCIGCREDINIDSLYQKDGDGDGDGSAQAVRPKEPASSMFGAAGGSSAVFGSLSSSSPGGSLFGGRDTGGAISFATLAANQSEGFGKPFEPASSMIGAAGGSSVAFGSLSSSGSLFGGRDTGGAISFATLAANQSEKFGQPFGKKASDKPFSFASTRASVFGGSASCRNGDDESHGEDEEYDPHYEPIVSLPDIRSKSTGEEDEAEMFHHRAKLFRFDRDSKAWKERGVGDIKILRNPKTGSARIVMRRDQIFKLCANHWITADMVLKPMMASETAWIWFAVDFSEEEARNEQLAVKFKHAEYSQRFKEAFLEAQKLLEVKEKEMKKEEKKEEKEVVSKTTESKTPSVTETNPQLTSLLLENDKSSVGKEASANLKAKMANKPGSWDCDACYCNNPSQTTCCLACGGPKPGAKAVPSSITKGASADGASAPSTLRAKFGKKPGSWDCDTCYTNNAAESLACTACTAPKPGSDPKPSPGAGASAGAIGDAFSVASGFTFGAKASGANAGLDLGGAQTSTAGSTTGSGATFKVPVPLSITGKSSASENSTTDGTAGAAFEAPSGFSFSSSQSPSSTGPILGAKKEDTQKPKETDTKAASTGFMFGGVDTSEAAPSTSSEATSPGGTGVTDTFTLGTHMPQFSFSGKDKPKSGAGFSFGSTPTKPDAEETKEGYPFSRALKTTESKTSIVTEANLQLTSLLLGNDKSSVGKEASANLKAKMANKPGSWDCDACYCNNPSKTTCCLACGGPKPGANAVPSSITKGASADGASAPSTLRAKFGKKPGSWDCDTCYTNNAAESLACTACTTPKPGSDPKPSPGAAAGASAGAIGDAFSVASGFTFGAKASGANAGLDLGGAQTSTAGSTTGSGATFKVPVPLSITGKSSASENSTTDGTAGAAFEAPSGFSFSSSQSPSSTGPILGAKKEDTQKPKETDTKAASTGFMFGGVDTAEAAPSTSSEATSPGGTGVTDTFTLGTHMPQFSFSGKDKPKSGAGFSFGSTPPKPDAEETKEGYPFSRALKTTESKTSSVTEANPQLTSLLLGNDKSSVGKEASANLKAKMANKPGSWDCDTCYTNNAAESLACAACTAPKPGSDPKPSAGAGAGASAGAIGDAFSVASGFTFGAKASGANAGLDLGGAQTSTAGSTTGSGATFKVPVPLSITGKSSASENSTTDGTAGAAFEAPSGFSFSSSQSPSSTGPILGAKKEDTQKPKETDTKAASTGFMFGGVDTSEAAPSTSSEATSPGGTGVTDTFTLGTHMPQFSFSGKDKPKSGAGFSFGSTPTKPDAEETKEGYPFSRALKTTESKTSSVTEANPQLTSLLLGNDKSSVGKEASANLKAKMANKPGSWDCDACYCNNPSQTTCCLACGGPKPGANAVPSSITKGASADGASAPSTLRAKFGKKPGSWDCDTCYTNNAAESLACTACTTPKPGSDPKPSPGAAAGASAGAIGDAFSVASGFTFGAKASGANAGLDLGGAQTSTAGSTTGSGATFKVPVPLSITGKSSASENSTTDGTAGAAFEAPSGFSFSSSQSPSSTGPILGAKKEDTQKPKETDTKAASTGFMFGGVDTAKAAPSTSSEATSPGGTGVTDTFTLGTHMPQFSFSGKDKPKSGAGFSFGSTPTKPDAEETKEGYPFSRALKTTESKTSIVTEANLQLTSLLLANDKSSVGKEASANLKAKMANKPGSWDCDACYCNNPSQTTCCLACGGPKPGANAVPSSITKGASADGASAPSTLRAKFGKKPGSWDCDTCYTNNAAESLACTACTTPKPGSDPKPSPGAAAGASAGAIGDAFSVASGFTFGAKASGANAGLDLGGAQTSTAGSTTGSGATFKVPVPLSITGKSSASENSTTDGTAGAAFEAPSGFSFSSSQSPFSTGPILGAKKDNTQKPEETDAKTASTGFIFGGVDTSEAAPSTSSEATSPGGTVVTDKFPLGTHMPQFSFGGKDKPKSGAGFSFGSTPTKPDAEEIKEGYPFSRALKTTESKTSIVTEANPQLTSLLLGNDKSSVGKEASANLKAKMANKPGSWDCDACYCNNPSQTTCCLACGGPKPGANAVPSSITKGASADGASAPSTLRAKFGKKPGSWDCDTCYTNNAAESLACTACTTPKPGSDPKPSPGAAAGASAGAIGDAFSVASGFTFGAKASGANAGLDLGGAQTSTAGSTTGSGATFKVPVPLSITGKSSASENSTTDGTAGAAFEAPSGFSFSSSQSPSSTGPILGAKKEDTQKPKETDTKAASTGFMFGGVDTAKAAPSTSSEATSPGGTGVTDTFTLGTHMPQFSFSGKDKPKSGAGFSFGSTPTKPDAEETKEGYPFSRALKTTESKTSIVTEANLQLTSLLLANDKSSVGKEASANLKAKMANKPGSWDCDACYCNNPSQTTCCLACGGPKPGANAVPSSITKGASADGASAPSTLRAKFGKKPGSWDCDTCYTNNAAESLACTACTTPKPGSDPKPSPGAAAGASAGAIGDAFSVASGFTFGAKASGANAGLDLGGAQTSTAGSTTGSGATFKVPVPLSITGKSSASENSTTDGTAGAAFEAPSGFSFSSSQSPFSTGPILGAKKDNTQKPEETDAKTASTGFIFGGVDTSEAAPSTSSEATSPGGTVVTDKFPLGTHMPQFSFGGKDKPKSGAGFSFGSTPTKPDAEEIKEGYPFSRALKTTESKTSIVTEANPQLTSLLLGNDKSSVGKEASANLKAKMANKPGSWDCDACYCNNPSQTTCCLACGGPKPGANAVPSSITKGASADGASAPSTLRAKFGKKPGSWDCDTCYTNNAAESLACTACTTPKPGSDPKPSPGAAAGASAGAIGDAFSVASGFTFGAKASGANAGLDLGGAQTSTAGSTTGSGATFKVPVPLSITGKSSASENSTTDGTAGAAFEAPSGFSFSSSQSPSSTGPILGAKKEDTQKPKETDTKAASTGFMFGGVDTAKAAPSTSSEATSPGGTGVTDTFTLGTHMPQFSFSGKDKPKSGAGFSFGSTPTKPDAEETKEGYPFSRALKTTESKTSIVTEANLQLTSLLLGNDKSSVGKEASANLKAKMANKPGSWDCDACYCNNPSQTTCCLACGGPKPGANAVPSSITKGASADGASAPSTLRAKFGKKPGSWDCDTCYTNNAAESLACTACTTPKPGSDPKPSPGAAAGASAGAIGDAFSVASGFTFGAKASGANAGLDLGGAQTSTAGSTTGSGATFKVPVPLSITGKSSASENSTTDGTAGAAFEAPSGFSFSSSQSPFSTGPILGAKKDNTQKPEETDAKTASTGFIFGGVDTSEAAPSTSSEATSPGGTVVTDKFPLGTHMPQFSFGGKDKPKSGAGFSFGSTPTKPDAEEIKEGYPFSRALKTTESKTSSVTEANPQLTSLLLGNDKSSVGKEASANLKAKMANKPGSWDCDACYCNSPSQTTCCLACGGPKPGAKTVPLSTTKGASAGASAPVASSTLRAKFGKKPGSLDCPTSYTNNAAESSACAACTAPKPGSAAGSTTGSGATFKVPAGLSFTGKSSASASNGSTPESMTTDDAASSGAALKLPSGFSFSSQLPASTVFTFCAKKEDMHCYDGGHRRSNTKPSTKAASTRFAPCLMKNNTLKLKKKVGATKAPSAGFPFGGTNKPSGKATSTRFIRDAMNENTQKPKENIRFSHRSKLYHYDGESKHWKEGGVGDIKVLYNSEDLSYRIVMRELVCTNRYITSSMALQPMSGSDCAWVWHAMQSADGEPTSEQLAIKFKDPSIAASFKEKFEEARARIRLQECSGNEVS